MARHRRKPKRKSGQGAIMVLLIILIIFAAIAVFISKRFAPSKVQTDLRNYYYLNADESEERAEASENELAIVLGDEILTTRAILEDNEIFIPYKLVKENIDRRFYIDIIEDVLTITTADDIISSNVESSKYTVNGAETDAGYKISTYKDTTLYINLKYVDEFSSANYKVLENPDRVYICYETGSFRYCTAKQSTYIRVKGGIKSDVVTKIDSGSKLKIISDLEDWLEVIDENGYRGYVQTKNVSEPFEETVTSDYNEPEYTHISVGSSVNMVWDSIYVYEANDFIYDTSSEVTGINVISPLWFTFADEFGTISSNASYDYVNFAHEKGWQVWAMINDIDGYGASEILSYTSRRQNAVNNLVSIAIEMGVDGINVDFENITSDEGDDYIQFIRELSVKCRANGLILSIDNYAPYNYNSHFQITEQSRLADYIIVMAYDDYLGKGEAGPNAGLPFVEEVLDLCKEKVDMSRLIVGIPFYTRIWREYPGATVNDKPTFDTEIYDMDDTNYIILEHGLTTEWLDDVGYDFCTYQSDGATVKVWYENAKSVEAKLKLISTYNVAGVSAWKLSQETSDVWAIIDQYY